MPPKLPNSANKGQTSLFSFFRKPATTAEEPVAVTPAQSTPTEETNVQKRSIDVAKEKSLVEKQSKKADSEDESATKRPRKTVIYDEEDDELPVRKPVKKAVTTSTKVNKAPSAKGNVESEDEWADEMSEASVSVASGGDDSFVVEDSEESAESSGDELFNSDSEEEVSRKKHKSAVKPPLVPSAKKAPTATKSTNKSVSNITTTPKKGNNGGRVLIPFDGSAMKTPGSVGSNPLSAFKQSNLALISPRSQSGSPFFGTPGSAAGTGSPSDAGSVHSFSGSTAAGGGGTPSTLVLPEGVVGRGSHEHNSFAFLLPENRRDGAGVKLGQAGFNPRTLQVPPKFLADQTPAMVQWWQFKAVNMDTVLFFKVGKFYELFHMDADIGFSELDLIYMKGAKAHSGFPEVSYGKFASILVSKGYRVARVEQTETPEMLKERNDSARGKKDKVVARELCSVMSKGTRTYCHLDDLSLLESEDPDRLSSSVLLCIKETLSVAPDAVQGAMDVTTGEAASGEVVEATEGLPEYGVCCVDTVLCTITLAQFQDDKQRSRLRTLLARYRPSEILLEAEQHSAQTVGVVQLLASRAAVELLRPESEMLSAKDTIKTLQKGQYFGSGGAKKGDPNSVDNPLRGWPAVMKAVHAGLEDGSSELVLSAMGGALWQLRRSLIDYEVLSLGKVFAYIPPDEHQLAAQVPSQEGGDSSEAHVRAHSLFSPSDSENHQVTFDLATDNDHAYEQRSTPAQSEADEERDMDMGGDVKIMTLDEVALTNLEILVNNYDRTEKGSLWAFINRTKTAFGRRLLRSWLCHPLYRPRDIARRQAAVAELLGPLAESAEAARLALRGIPDLERLLTRVHSNGLRRRGPVEHPDSRAILYENYNVRKIKDFADVLTGFEIIVKVGNIFDSRALTSPLLKLALQSPAQGGKFPKQEIKELLAHFREIFDEKQAKRDGNIRPRQGIDPDFDQAKEEIAQLETALEQYLREMKKAIGVSDLKFFGTNKDRYQIEVPMAQTNKVPADWTSKSQKKTHRRFWTPVIEEYLEQLVSAEERLAVAQKDTLRRVFEKFDASFALWSGAISCISLLDALLSVATVSSFPGYCKPEVRAPREQDGYTPELNIVGGRHPMLEFSLLQRGEGDCIPNDLVLGGVRNNTEYLPRMLLLSGPNMGGKSTLLRQTCLIAVLAQIGCWVPAESCRMTPVDRIFTRVGASDRILAGQSTFFVELAETATILSAATKNSLCILDELGRGTATFDGTAIAHAVVEHLVSRQHCRTLFATHYHSLVSDWELDPRVRLGHMDCLVQDTAAGEAPATATAKAASEEVTFLYKLSDGSSPRSYGINVARLAGLPAAVIELALQQSRAFEERMQASQAAAAAQRNNNPTDSVAAQSGGDSAALLTVDQVQAVFERLVSVAQCTSGVQELAYVAAELWKRLHALELKSA